MVRSGWKDISVPLQSEMAHFPDVPAVRISRTLDMDHGDICNVTAISMSAHAGTHIDAPSHFIKSGKSIDQMPFDAVMGPARVILIRDPKWIQIKELEKYHIQKGERILFKTLNSSRCWKTKSFIKNYVYLPEESAKYLAKMKVRTVGIDYLSIGGFNAGLPETHKALLREDIWVIEGLNLSKVKPGNYELICLPIKILKADGAPARAIIRSV